MSRDPVDPVVLEHLRRTTKASGVPERLDDEATAELVAALLATRTGAAPRRNGARVTDYDTTPRPNGKRRGKG